MSRDCSWCSSFSSFSGCPIRSARISPRISFSTLIRLSHSSWRCQELPSGGAARIAHHGGADCCAGTGFLWLGLSHGYPVRPLGAGHSPKERAEGKFTLRERAFQEYQVLSDRFSHSRVACRLHCVLFFDPSCFSSGCLPSISFPFLSSQRTESSTLCGLLR